MRYALLLSLLLSVLPAAAQKDPIPDTTEAWRYYPLEIGNVWEYHYREFGSDDGYERFEVIGDSTVNGRTYRVLALRQFDLDRTEAGWQQGGYPLLRFDTLSAQVYQLASTGNEFISTCPFDAAFNSEVSCMGYEDNFYMVYGGYEGEVHIGDDIVHVDAQKTFFPFADVPVPTYAADIGITSKNGFISPGSFYRLTYVRLVRDGEVIVYGSPAPVANEPEVSPPDGLTLSAYPNPFTEAVTLRLAVPAPQRVTVEVFDALGRRVHAEERVAGGTTHLRIDAADWAPGLYLVRLGTSEGRTATARLVRR